MPDFHKETNATFTSDPQVLVLGAGPVGLALASELRRHGVTCRIVDKHEGTTKWSKALVVHARTMEVFERMGMIGDALDRGRRSRGAVFNADGRDVLHIDLDNLDAPYNFFLDLNQADTEAVLERHLERLGGRVEWQTEVVKLDPAADGVGVRLKTAKGEEEARFAYVCACDGAHSFARSTLGLPFPGNGYEAQFLLADVKLDWDRAPDKWYIFIHPDSMFFAAALKEEGRWRVITELPRGDAGPPPASLARGESPTLGEVQALVARHAPEGTRAHDPNWLSWFKVSHRILDSFRHGRVFFSGDAAHIHSPVGGQGLNTGVQDAFNLAWKLALVLKGEASESLLDSYDAERRRAAGGVVELTDMATRNILADRKFRRVLRDSTMSLVDRLSPVKGRLERVISEVAIEYRRSPIVSDHWAELRRSHRPGDVLAWLGRWYDFRHAPRPGDRAPDGRLRQSDNTVARLHELLHGTGFHILHFPAREAARLGHPQGRTILERARAQFGDRLSMIEVGPGCGSEEAGVTRLSDDRGATRRAYGVAGDALFLIRPDGYVSFRGYSADGEALLRHLGRILRPAHDNAAVEAARGSPEVTEGPARGRSLALAAIFAVSGVLKVSCVPLMKRMFAGYGLPRWLMYAVGLCELMGAAAVTAGPSRAVGAGVLGLVSLGAAGTHAKAREPLKLLGALALLSIAGSVIRTTASGATRLRQGKQ